MRILVVEDERLMADTIADVLRRDAFAVDVVYDGEAALQRLAINNYDVVVLDRYLPKVSGDQVCQRIVDSGANELVLMVTAAVDVIDRVKGLGLGADDYLAKPFVLDELVARVHALGRRSRPAVPPVLERSGIRLDQARHEAFRNDRYLPLSRKEFAVLVELLRAEGTVVSTE
ncbi:MAG: response regulator transcription factor, partial [Mycobacteriales bacterium]